MINYKGEGADITYSLPTIGIAIKKVRIIMPIQPLILLNRKVELSYSIKKHLKDVL